MTVGLRLVPIGPLGDIGDEGRVDSFSKSICHTTAEFFHRVGYVPPWIAYLAQQEGSWVGTASFKGPPQSGRVEIAYFTFPHHEGTGLATEMARQLLLIARAKDPKLEVYAQTEPKDNASTRILSKLGFRFSGRVQHPEDGLVWEWTLRPGT